MILRGFVGPTYKMDALTYDSQRTINLYPIISETGTSKSVAALRSVPGYVEEFEAGGGPIRGCITTGQGRAFVVSGNEVYEITTGGAVSRGTINTGTVRVSMAENGNEVIIVDGVDGWIFNLTTDTLTEITDPHFPTCSSVTFLDGYFIVQEDLTNNFYISGIYDGTSWDPLDFSQAVSNSDNLVSVFSDSGNLWLFGTRSVEVFNNTGAQAFPFERISGAIIQTGCAATHTVQAFDNTIAWLGQDSQGRGVVWKANGYQAQRISTQAIEGLIAEAPDYTESYAYVYHEQGHVFYCLQVKGIDTTPCYDASTNLWHERQFNDTVTNTTQQHRGSCHFFFNQKNYIGDRLTGQIYSQRLDLYDFDGEAMHRTRISPHYAEGKINTPFSNFELDMETGKGLLSGQGSAPRIVMQYSDDGGRTWSNELWKDVGALGNYTARVRWSRLGSSRARVFKVKYTEPTFFQINEAFVNVA